MYSPHLHNNQHRLRERGKETIQRGGFSQLVVCTIIQFDNISPLSKHHPSCHFQDQQILLIFLNLNGMRLVKIGATFINKQLFQDIKKLRTPYSIQLNKVYG